MELENLDLVTEIYTNDPFERENTITEMAYVDRCREYSQDRSLWLELGLGHGYVLRGMSEANQRVLVLDGSPALVDRYDGMYGNVEIELTYFENYTSDRRFPNIGMGFILEHVNDPRVILDKYRKMLEDDGRIFVAVPSASSLHRLIAHKAGLLSDIRMMSETDARFGHKRYLTFEEWMAIFHSMDFRVERAEGLYLKPLTTAQLESLELDKRIYEALSDMARDLPQISNSCFFVLKNA